MSVTVRFSDGDLEFDSTGGQVLIGNAEKAAQDLLHELMLPYSTATDRGNEMFNPDGSMVSVIGSPDIGAQSLRTYLKGAVKRLQRAQQRDSNTDREEIIRSIKTLLVQPLGDDVTSYGFYLAVDVDDENIAVAREIRMRHLGNSPYPLVGGYDP